jgi:hypothetical protein
MKGPFDYNMPDGRTVDGRNVVLKTFIPNGSESQPPKGGDHGVGGGTIIVGPLIRTEVDGNGTTYHYADPTTTGG